MNGVTQSTYSWLQGILGDDFQLEKHSYSNQADVYSVQTPNNRLYLKISHDLKRERDNLEMLKPYLSVPEVVDFKSIDQNDCLLMTEVRGKNLAEFVGDWDDTVIVREFARAVKNFHLLDIDSLYPSKHAAGYVVLHGDMSMPNIITTSPGSVGYIDLGQMATGSPDKDLADAIWSLQRNIGPDYGELFLKEYGDVVMTERIDKALKFRFDA